MEKLKIKLGLLVLLLTATLPACALPAGETGPGQGYVLALGDSYTIGSGVRSTEAFAWQLAELLRQAPPGSGQDGRGPQGQNPRIVAQLGWTTANLLAALERQAPAEEPCFVTLLIGVNNQYQGRPFAQYETEFPLLLQQALDFVGGDPQRVLVLSIPDYRYTPFGRNLSPSVSQEIDRYNSFAQSRARAAGVAWMDITGLSRRGLEEPGLVAPDGLHLSARAYAQVAQDIARWWLGE